MDSKQPQLAWPYSRLAPPDEIRGADFSAASRLLGAASSGKVLEKGTKSVGRRSENQNTNQTHQPYLVPEP